MKHLERDTMQTSLPARLSLDESFARAIHPEPLRLATSDGDRNGFCVLLVLIGAVIAAVIADHNAKLRRELREAERQKSLESLPPQVRQAVKAMDQAGKDHLSANKSKTYAADGIEVQVTDRQDINVRRLP